MEEKLLAVVLLTDIPKRLQGAEELVEYFSRDSTVVNDFPDLDQFISGLASWMGNSNFKVSIKGMEILAVLISRMKASFKPYLSNIFSNLRERLGDAKEVVREQAQILTQKILEDVVSSPQAFLDKFLESCFSHKNWRVKEQGLVCLVRTLSYFGSGQISVSRYMLNICTLLDDANSQVRSCSMETLVELYRHVGVKIRIDMSRRGLQASKLSQITARFNAVDATTGCPKSEDMDEDGEASVGSAGSGASAHTHNSTRSASSCKQNARPTISAATSSIGIADEDFFKAFEDTPHINLFTHNDVEKTLKSVNSILSDTKKEWNIRVLALKELRSVVKNETTERTHFLSILKTMEASIITSLKDLRSQVVREVCISLSYIATIYGPDFALFAELVFPSLINVLSNSAKVMASSANVCLKMIIKNTPNYRLLTPLLSQGITSKSPIIRRSSVELFYLSLTTWSTNVFEKKSHLLLQSILLKGLLDPDVSTRKHSRKAYWAYSSHFPVSASKMMENFDAQLQKHVIEEKPIQKGNSGIGINATTHYSSHSLPRPVKKKKVLSHPKTEADIFTSKPRRPTLPTSPSSKDAPNPSMIIRSLSSMECRSYKDISSSVSPIPRPPSRTEVRDKISVGRPQSRSGKYGQDYKRPASRSSGKRLSRSCQPSPAVSRDSSPLGIKGVASGGAINMKMKQTAGLSKEEMMELYGFGKGGSRDKEDDDSVSVSSEKSSYSITSEVSVNPFAKYTHPVTDLPDLVLLCTSSKWSERKDGIAQLHMLLETSHPLTHNDMQKVREIFKRMFSESHTKVFSMFLDTLSKFIEEHKEYIEDWLYLMLLRLLHRQGSDMLSSVHFKLQLVLEQIRRAFDPGSQFNKMCRVLTDQTQPMNTKVKLTWLEYFLELLPLVEAANFQDISETRQALSKLLGFTTEPKSAEIRRQSQKVVTKLFDLNTATLSLMLSSLPRLLQDSADRILKGYLAEMSSSGDESDREKQLSPKSPHTPSSAGKRRFKTASGGSNPMAGLPPSSPRGMGISRSFSSSTPDIAEPQSRIPAPSSKKVSSKSTPQRIPPRSMSTTPGSTPSTGRRRGTPRRPQSVGPEKLADQRENRLSGKNSRQNRPGSATSDYTPSTYQNGGRDFEASLSGSVSATSIEKFSFSDLPNLDDYGDEQGDDDYLHRDKMSVIVRELTTAQNSKLRNAALQMLFAQARDSPSDCQWDEYFKTVLLRLIELLSDEEVNIKMMCLRVLREMLKTEGKRLINYAELTTIKVLKGFADPDNLVSQAAEDVFDLLAPALPSESAICLLSPMTSQEKYPMLFGTIKLLTKVIGSADPEYLKMKLTEIVPGVIHGYCHNESGVRKASVFCLVALQGKVGDAIKEHLSKLSSSQTKLLELYIKKAQQDSTEPAMSQK